MDLYLDRHPELMEKDAGYSARLSDQTDTWAQEASSELLKQYPFFSDYELNPILDRAEDQRGYGFGYIDVTNPTERPEEEHDEAGIPHIRVPIIVQERQLRPFSVFLDGEAVKPLNETRIRETLFNPQTFDLTTIPPTDPSLVDNFMPPNRSGMGLGGEFKMASVEQEKIAVSKKWIERKVKDFAKGVATGDPSRRAAGFKKLEAFAGRNPSSDAANLSHKLKTSSITKEAFSHITPEQWEALYKNPKIVKLVETYGKYDHPEVDNQVFELAAKRYGYHPKIASVDMSGLKELGKKKVQGVKDVATYGFKKKEASLLRAIAETISESDAQAFINKLAEDMTLRVGLKPFHQLLVDVFDKTKRASADERLAAIAENLSPTVVTMQKLPGGDFLVKSANVNAFAGGQQAQGQVVPEQQMQQDVGADVTGAMKPGQSATATADPVKDTEPTEAFEGQPVAEFGQYVVEDTMGNQLMGWVIPELLAWDGNFSPMPVQLFTNGSAYAMQEGISGKLVGKGLGLPVDEPRGEGVFYSVTNDGVQATCPLTVTAAMAGPDGNPVYQGQDPFGNPVTVRTMAGMLNPERISNQEYALPQGWSFMRLNNQTQLGGAGGQVNKTAAAREWNHSVTLYWNGAFQLDGGCGLDKVASDYRYDLDALSAEFMLGLLGVDGTLAKQKVAEARKKGSVKLAGLKTITLLGERHADAVKIASAFLADFPDLRVDLVKEAAALQDEGTVDKVLALNFLNPENVSTFVEYLPEIEATGEKMAEMLLNGYLGLEELPTSAIERSMKGMEEVVSGLKAMQQAHQEG